ncbi:hypothetical protein [Phenylobacterium sp.]
MPHGRKPIKTRRRLLGLRPELLVALLMVLLGGGAAALSAALL